MLTANENLEKYLQEKILKITTDTELLKLICLYAKETYEIPKSITSDYLTLRKPVQEASEFILFCLLDSIKNTSKNVNVKLEDYFTNQEIKGYKGSKYKVDKIKFPIRFEAIQVTDDQWVGKIDFSMLMKLRAAQLITYNENAQRSMQKVIRGGKEVYKITINETAIKSITKMYNEGIYIPTPFTLNIPQEIESDFYYDNEMKELVIKSLDGFDILDGYHRYVAACRINNANPDFNYTMELRIVNFVEDKARQFVYQEAQKTKMPKTDSDAMDSYKASNSVVKRLNGSSQFNLQGLISMNKGIINFAELSGLIHYFYFNGITSKEKEKVVLISAIKELTDNFNALTEYDIKYIEHHYSYKKLTAIMCVFDYFKDKDKKYMCKIIDEVVEKVEQLDNKKFYSRTPKKVVMNSIEKIIYEVEEKCITKN
jgi:hypothetical protein